MIGFVNTVMNFASHYVQGISGITEEFSSYEEEIWSMDSVC
jgi:hypothetical protein